VVHALRLPQSSAGHDIIVWEVVTIRQESVEVEITPAIHEESIEAQIQPMICKESVNPAVIHEETVNIEIPPAIQVESMEAVIPPEEDEMGWEDDLNECVQGGGVENFWLGLSMKTNQERHEKEWWTHYLSAKSTSFSFFITLQPSN